MLIRNILVAVDGSENSNRALDFALDLAEKFGSAVMVLNVSEVLAMGVVPQESTTYSFENMSILGKDLRKIHEEILSKAVSHAKTVKPDLAVSSMLRDGDPALEIVNVAKDSGFDAIVIGHKSSGMVRERFLGSISEKVAHLAPCPVVIVR
jgi:nucleotide-binding universal stress UspA family protein